MAESKRMLKVRPVHENVCDPIGLAANINRRLPMDRDSVLPDDATSRKWLRNGTLLPADDETRERLRKLNPNAPALKADKPGPAKAAPSRKGSD